LSELFSFYSKRNPDDTSKGRQLNVKWELICNIYIRRRLTPYLVGRARRQRYISQCEVSRISELVFFYEHVCCTDDTFREEINFAQASRSPRLLNTTWDGREISLGFVYLVHLYWTLRRKIVFPWEKNFKRVIKKWKITYFYICLSFKNIYTLLCICYVYIVYILYIYIYIYILYIY